LPNDGYVGKNVVGGWQFKVRFGDKVCIGLMKTSTRLGRGQKPLRDLPGACWTHPNVEGIQGGNVFSSADAALPKPNSEQNHHAVCMFETLFSLLEPHV